MSELFVALRCEELPARFIDNARNQLESRLIKLLKGIPHGETKTWSTPRRIAVSIQDVADSSPVKESLLTGPPKAAAFRPNADGELEATKAAIGFARSKGLSVEDLEIVDSKRGPVIAARVKTGGEKTMERVAKGLEEVILGMDFPKTMRWGQGKVKWARPIHGLIAMLNGELVDASVCGLRTSAETVGHRLNSEPFTVVSSSDWTEKLRSKNVEPDHIRRKELIREQLINLAKEHDAEIHEWDLLEEVNNIVEWPVTIAGTFAEDLLELPPKLLIESMKVHQRVFPLHNSGKLISAFLVVTNQPYAKDPEVSKIIAHGNKKVLTARFYDAKFFYAEDRKRALESHGERLAGMKWIRNGGSMLDKSQRISNLAGSWSTHFGADTQSTRRAGLLCKNDLTTKMVTEFPKLQGHVGRLLAGFDGEAEAVIPAIEEHYMPRFSGDRIASTPEGRALACADRWDTLDGCFAQNMQPKGSGDPLGLRRAANGFLSTLIEANVSIDIGDLCKENPNGKELHQFVLARLRNQFQEKYATDLVNAVLATGDNRPLELNSRLKAMNKLSQAEDFSSIRATFKRVMGLTKNHESNTYNAEGLLEKEEKDLHEALSDAQKAASMAAEDRDYDSALKALGSLKPRVDAFFDTVLVMADQEELRNNRLGLLKTIADAFREIADFTLLSTEN